MSRLKDLTRNMDGTWNLTVTLTGDCRALWDKYRNQEVDVEIKKHREKRSLDANAYCWVLISQIAAKMRLDKVDVYRESIKAIGGNSTIVCVKNEAVDALRAGWQSNGIGWITDTMPSKIKGCTNVILFFGSSVYDTRQMSLLIDHVIQDAKSLGIETMPPAELQKMVESWHSR